MSDVISPKRYCVQLHIEVASKRLEEPEKAQVLDSLVHESKRAMVRRISPVK